MIEIEMKQVERRTKAIKLLLEALNSSYPDSYCNEDFMIDKLIRQVYSFPGKSLGKEPYADYLIDTIDL